MSPHLFLSFKLFPPFPTTVFCPEAMMDFFTQNYNLHLLQTSESLRYNFLWEKNQELEHILHINLIFSHKNKQTS